MLDLETVKNIGKSVSTKGTSEQKEVRDSTLAFDGTFLLRRQFHVLRKGFVDSGEVDENGEKILVQDPIPVVLSTLTCVVKKMRETGFDWKVRLLFDRGSYHYRPKEKFVDYKADREYDNTYQCCWDATDIYIGLARDLGLTTIQIPGLEADDLGMYYSHNSKECILFSVDSDWRQSLTPTTIIDNTKRIITYRELMDESIFESPFDLALMKAIDSGGHDNVQKVLVENSVIKPIKEQYPTLNKNEHIFIGYKEKRLPAEIIDQINHNLQLTRLDRILTDSAMFSKIKTQERIEPNTAPVRDILVKHLGESKGKAASPNLVSQIEKFRAIHYNL